MTASSVLSSQTGQSETGPLSAKKGGAMTSRSTALQYTAGAMLGTCSLAENLASLMLTRNLPEGLFDTYPARDIDSRS